MTARKFEAKTRPKAQKSPNKRSSVQSGDYSIFVQIDGIKSSAPWRINSYEDDGALSESDLLELAEQHTLPSSILVPLSQNLGYCLDTESMVGPVRINRAVALERAQEPLQEAARLARRVESDIKKISTYLEGLSDHFKQQKEDALILRSAKSHVEALLQTSVGLEIAIDGVIKTPGSAAVMTPFNKTHVADGRRRHVIETCCYAWMEAGRSLTFTSQERTYGGTDRGGPLIDFLQAVVVKLTDPPTMLSGETIRKDIERLRKKLAEPDELTTPPDRGIDDTQ